VRIRCLDLSLSDLLSAYYGAMVSIEPSAVEYPDYIIGRDAVDQLIAVAHTSRSSFVAEDEDDLLFLLEDELAVLLQSLRSDLYFLHAASVERGGKVVVLAGESGAGKSTSTWGLLHHGFRYLSDELSPIDLSGLRVYPYPRALCLKQPVPAYPVPDMTIDFGRARHVPVASMPAEAARDPLPLGLVILVRYRSDLARPVARRLSPAEAAARLYVTALNPLAHSNYGLDAVAEIARQVPCYMLESADLSQTCALIRSVADETLDLDRLPATG
jgi:hypothetical protein